MKRPARKHTWFFAPGDPFSEKFVRVYAHEFKISLKTTWEFLRRFHLAKPVSDKRTMA